MAEVLSQDEIERLLNAINAASVPDIFPGEQVQAISYIHETFAILTSYSLSAHIRSRCHIHFSFIDQLTYEAFISSLPAQTTLAVINMNPLKGNAILKIGTEMTFAIIDRICGGRGDGTKFQHGLTDIETSIINNIIVHILGNMRKAWKPAVDIHPRVEAIHTDPQSVRIDSPNEIVLSISLETMIGETKGIMNICIPCSTIEPVMEKLSNWYWNKNPDNTPSNSSEEKSEHVPKENEKKKFRSFDYFNHVDPAVFLDLFINEHPQVIALILAHMEADKASVALQYLPDSTQSNVLRRIATMDRVRLEIASEIERTLENKLVVLFH